MADKISPTTGPLAVLNQARDLWDKQPRGRKTFVMATLAVVVGIVVWATVIHKGEQWVVVSEGVSPTEVSELYSALRARDIPARMSAANKIEVPSDRATEATSIATAAGIGNGIVGLEIVGDEPLGASSTTEQMNIQRGLQGELARMISGMSQVERARVMIAFGKHSPFKDQEQPPSASVALRLHTGQMLSGAQVQGIRMIVAKAINGLQPDEVVIVDQHGNLLLSGESTDADHKTAIERMTTQNVRGLLEKTVGAGKVAVVTTADFDASKTNATEERYDKDAPALRSESTSAEGPGAAAGIGGIAGTQGNLPGATPAAPTTGSGASGKMSATRNYEISRKITQTEGANGVLKKLHVAILVDDKRDDKGKVVGRSDVEVKQLTSIARTAAGFDEARGDTLDLQSMPFAAETDLTATPPVVPVEWTEKLPLPLPIMAAAAGGVLLLLVAVAFALFVRSRRRRARREAAEVMPIALPAPLAELERILEARPAIPGLAAAPIEAALPAGPSVQDRVLTAVRADVERAAAVLTSWLAEPPPKGAKP